MGSTKRFLAIAGVACAAIAAPARAEPAGAPPTREQCLDAHEQGQSLRLGGKLVAARRALRECSAAACPALVSRDCVAWLSDVEQLMPSVIFRAAKDGADVAVLRIREGERVLAESLTGTPLELDPGPHHFTAELPGFAPRQATYVLQAGDKARVVRFEFTTPAAPAPAPVALPSAPSPAPAAPPTTRPVPSLVYPLGGAALAAVITGGVLGGLALSQRSEVSDRCEPLCRERDVEPVRRLALGADISLLVALLAGGAAGYVYATRPAVAQPEAAGLPRVELQASAHDWQLLAGGRF
jgi:hypothetical protein